ncbi:MAG: glycosyl transferase family 2 [archaeon GW2011_AR21]|nr:MAG: glycosyl transferase family 2 [archaeon GW2011_AR21]
MAAWFDFFKRKTNSEVAVKQSSIPGAGKVIVMIPAYNEEKYIGRTIDLLKREQDVISEIVVIDDGSRDATSRIAKEKGATVLRLQKNTGKTGAFIQGLRYCHEKKADIILNLDADLIKTDTKSQVVELVSHLVKNPALLMVFARAHEKTSAGFNPVEHAYNGNKAFRMKAFNPFFKGNKKWVSLLSSGGRYGLEEALRYLIRRERVSSLFLSGYTPAFYFREACRGSVEVKEDKDIEKIRNTAAERQRKARELMNQRRLRNSGRKL